MELLRAMAWIEGYFVKGTRPRRNNNPCDIMAGKFTSTHGATGSDGRFAVFPTPRAGFECAAALLNSKTYKGKTIEAALRIWAPPNENATEKYIDAVCKLTKLARTDIISDHLEIPNV